MTILKGPFIQSITDEQFVTLCESNSALKIERLSNREVLISKRTLILDDSIVARAIDQLNQWNKMFQFGSVIIDKGFLLPNGGVRNATVAWVSTKRLVSAVTRESALRELCPDFILEFKDPQEDLSTAKSKMKEWIANGCQLAWLIDEKREVVYIFEKAKTRMHMNFTKELSAEPVLPGFVLKLS